MSFDLTRLQAAVAAHGRVARVVVAAAAGSAPREAGAAVLVWDKGQSGTIGGGALEWDAVASARAAVQGSAAPSITRVALGPDLGQCCGGAVTLVTEVFDAATLETLENTITGGHVARCINGSPDAMPLELQRLLGQARNSGLTGGPALCDGWLFEPLQHSRQDLWLYGAGHVGRAIVATLAPLPDWTVTWVDTVAARFPDDIPEGVDQLIAASPARVVRHAPAEAHHLILTYSHALDLELCHQVLEHGFATAGLIGSATKWARFRRRLEHLGHSAASIARITCPIGAPALGKHPQAIAIGVVADLLKQSAAADRMTKERSA